MKRIGFIFENVCMFENLIRAAYQAMQGKKDKWRIAEFHLNLENHVMRLKSELLSGEYRPGPYRCFEIYEPKRRYI